MSGVIYLDKPPKEGWLQMKIRVKIKLSELREHMKKKNDFFGWVIIQLSYFELL